MLKLKHLSENYALAEKNLENWDYDKSNLADMLSKFRISSNAIYPFCQGGEIFFLRLAPADEKLEKNIMGELDFICYLVDRKFPALEPVRTKTGELWIKTNTEWGLYYASVFKQVKGKEIENTDFSHEIMFEYGKTLGKLHSLSALFVPTVKKWSHIEVLDWMRCVLQEYEAKDYVLSELNAIADKFEEIPIHSDNYGLIHYDFEPDNVFFDQDTKTCAVIDFDDGMYHWYALDIEQVFDSLGGELGGKSLEAAKQAFIEGYKTEHSYTNEMDASLPLMRRFINLYSYARLIRCVAENFADEPEWLTDLRKKLDKTIINLESAIMKP